MSSPSCVHVAIPFTQVIIMRAALREAIRQGRWRRASHIADRILELIGPR